VPGPITKDDTSAFLVACKENPVLPTCGGGSGATKDTSSKIKKRRHATKPNPKVIRRSLQLLG